MVDNNNIKTYRMVHIYVYMCVSVYGHVCVCVSIKIVGNFIGRKVIL